MDRDPHRSKCDNKIDQRNFARSYFSSCDHRNFHSRVRFVTRREYRAQGIAGDDVRTLQSPPHASKRWYSGVRLAGGCVVASALVHCYRCARTHFEVGGHAVKAVDGVSFDVRRKTGIVGESGQEDR